MGTETLDAGVVVAVEVSRTGAFDLDDAGSEVCELAGAEGAGYGLFEGYHEDAGEGEVGSWGLGWG